MCNTLQCTKIRPDNNHKFTFSSFYAMKKTPSCGNNLSHYNTTRDFENSMIQIRTVAYQIFAPSLIVIGILGNILNLIVLGKPFLKGCTRIYLRCLAIADLLVLLFDIPLVVRLNEIQGTSLHTAIYYAHFELVFATIFIAFSSFIVLCLTVDRYISVCIPMLFTKIHTKTKAKIALAIIFIIAIVASAPLFLMKTVCQLTEECNTNPRWSFQDNTEITDQMYWYVYLVTSEVLVRIGPAVTLAILNILIIKKFRIITKRRNNFLVPSQQLECTQPKLPTTTISVRRTRKYHEEKRLIVLLQAVVILFFMTMLPSSCLSFIYNDQRANDLTFQIFRAIANLLEIANSALNFCAYFLCSREFRKGLISVLSGKNKKVENRANIRTEQNDGVQVISVQNCSIVTNNDNMETSTVYKEK